MIRTIIGVIQAVKGGIDLYFYLKQKQRDRRLKEALADLQKAESKKEIFDAQKRLTDNLP